MCALILQEKEEELTIENGISFKMGCNYEQGRAIQIHWYHRVLTWPGRERLFSTYRAILNFEEVRWRTGVQRWNGVAENGICGLVQLKFPGATPTSEGAHFSLFGYDPEFYKIRRGIITATGAGLAARKGEGQPAMSKYDRPANYERISNSPHCEGRRRKTSGRIIYLMIVWECG